MDILSGVFSRVRSISNPAPAPPRGPNVAANFDSRTTSLARKASDTSISEPPRIQIQPTADTQQDIVKLSVLKSMAFSPCITLQAKEHVQVSLQHLDNLKCGTLTIRGRVWLLRMRAGRDQMQQRRDTQCYQRLKKAQVSPIHLDQIQKDLDRTYPQYAIFHEATFQKAMSDVLHAIAAYRPEVGYCQGMGYIVGFLNTLMTEEDTFWFVIQMMDKLGMSNYWSPSLTALPKSFFLIEKLIDTHLPRLGRHFKETGMCPSMYATPWIMTLFLYNYSIPFVTRLWDLILYEGLYYVYVIALSILTAHEEDMLTMQMEDLMSLLQPSSRRGEKEQDVEEVLRRANRMKFSVHASLVKFEDQWLQQQLTKEGMSMHATI